jgi:FkbM family methyltransferase
MQLSLKELIRGAVKKSGYEILGRRSSYAGVRSLNTLIQKEGITHVLDVGANEGQFAKELREGGYGGLITSFEPLPIAHATLMTSAAGDTSWNIAERTAIGAEDGTITIHVAGNSVSSSVLPMHDNHVKAAPESRYVGTEIVPLHRVDTLIKPNPVERLLLKIDVQGYEVSVLEGATALLPSCRAVKLEMSLVPLYEGQADALELWKMLAGLDFQPWSFEPGYRDPATQRMLQMDGIFVRADRT